MASVFHLLVACSCCLRNEQRAGCWLPPVPSALPSLIRGREEGGPNLHSSSTAVSAPTQQTPRLTITLLVMYPRPWASMFLFYLSAQLRSRKPSPTEKRTIRTQHTIHNTPHTTSILYDSIDTSCENCVTARSRFLKIKTCTPTKYHTSTKNLEFRNFRRWSLCSVLLLVLRAACCCCV